MTRAEAERTFGRLILAEQDYQVRAKIEEDGLHIYAFRVEDGCVMLPRGFVLGMNSMHYERRKK